MKFYEALVTKTIEEGNEETEKHVSETFFWGLYPRVPVHKRRKH